MAPTSSLPICTDRGDELGLIYGLEDFTRTGQDLEKVVLSRAVRRRLEHRILSYANENIVFG